LAIARRRGFRDIAFPAIATGIYGFPGQEAAEIAVATVISHLARHQSLELVTFVCFDPATLEAYRKALGEEAWSIETLVLDLLICSLAFVQFLATLFLAAPEPNSVFLCLRFSLGAPPPL
jgi:hypothetical protein